MQAREGRAQRSLLDVAVANGWMDVVKYITPGHGPESGQQAQVFFRVEENLTAQKLDGLKKCLGSQVFGIAAGHVEIAKSEASMFACWRLQSQGIRSTILVSAFAIKDYLSKIAHKGQGANGKVIIDDAIMWITQCSQESLSSFANACPGAILRATIGPQDALWTPFGWLVFHQVLALM